MASSTVQHVFEETETTSTLTNDVRDSLQQITEEVRNLKTSVMAVVRKSTDANYSNGDNANAGREESEDSDSNPATLEGEDAGTEAESATP